MYRVQSPLFLAALLLLPLTLIAGDNKSSSNSNKMTPNTKLLVMRDLTAERVFVRIVIPRGDGVVCEIKDGKITPSDRAVAQTGGGTWIRCQARRSRRHHQR